MIPKVMSWKKDTVNDLHALLTSGDTIAVIDIHGVPASAMFGMRAELRQSMKIQVAKKRLMKIAWERAGYDLPTSRSSTNPPSNPRLSRRPR